MLLSEALLRSERPSNNSATYGFVWEKFNFDGCKGHEEGKYIWAFFTTLCFALGFPASVTILWDMFKTYRRGTPLTPNNFFIVNLTVMDVVFLAFIPPGLLNHFFWKSWPFEAFWNFTFAMNTCGRPLLMACICVDCYLAVVHPITYHKRKSLTPRVVMAAVVWTFTVASGIAYFLFFSLYYSMFPAASYIAAIVIIGLCDSFILHTLVQSDPGRKNIHPQKQRAIQTLVNSLVMTVLSYLPPVLLLAIGRPLINDLNTFACIIGIPMTISSTSGSTVMPILHLKNQGKLDLLRLTCCKKS